MPGGISASAPTAPITAGNAERVRQDRGVRRARPFLADEPDHVLAIELHRQSGRELVGHDDDLLVGRDGPELVPHATHQPVEHPKLDGVQVGQTLAQPGGAGPEVAELERLELVRGLGAELVVADQGLDRGQEIGVLRHQDLGVEDSRLLGPRALEYALAEIAQVGHDVVHGVPEPAHLLLHVLGLDRAVRHLREVHPDDEGRRAGHARRDADAPERASHLSPPRTRSPPARRGPAPPARRRGPLARMVISLPHSAASIMTPMMLLPLTSMPSFESSISAEKVLARRTIRAAGRAWSPSWLTMVAWRSITGPSSGRRAAAPWRAGRSARW